MLILIVLFLGRANGMITIDRSCPNVQIKTREITKNIIAESLYLKEFYEITDEFGPSLPTTLCVKLTFVFNNYLFSGIRKMQFDQYEYSDRVLRVTTSRCLLLGIEEDFRMVFYYQPNGQTGISSDCDVRDATSYYNDMNSALGDFINTQVILSEDEREIAFYYCKDINTTHSSQSFMYFSNNILSMSSEIEKIMKKLIPDWSRVNNIGKHLCYNTAHFCDFWNMLSTQRARVNV